MTTWDEWHTRYDGEGADPSDIKAVVRAILGSMGSATWATEADLFDNYGPGTPSCTDGCPFMGKLSPRYLDPSEIDNDPSEAYYYCHLLKKEVWVEHGPCEKKDWSPLIQQFKDYVNSTLEEKKR